MEFLKINKDGRLSRRFRAGGGEIGHPGAPLAESQCPPPPQHLASQSGPHGRPNAVRSIMSEMDIEI